MSTDTLVVKCPICGRPYVVVPHIRTSNACLSCTREAEKNSGLDKKWEYR